MNIYMCVCVLMLLPIASICLLCIKADFYCSVPQTSHTEFRCHSKTHEECNQLSVCRLDHEEHPRSQYDLIYIGLIFIYFFIFSKAFGSAIFPSVVYFTETSLCMAYIWKQNKESVFSSLKWVKN